MIFKTEQEVMKNWSSTETMVSVSTITYNHEAYIAEALDSFLMQETDFAFELLVSDDCSTDKTASIIKEYMEKYPHIVKAKLRDENVGAMKNYIANMDRAKGKYIAICDGDDYWIDTYKLKKQVSFLEENEDFIGVAANTFRLYENDSHRYHLMRESTIEVIDYEHKDLFEFNPGPTLTIMFRNGFIDFKNLPSLFSEQPHLAGDKQLYLLLGQYGKFRYINQVVGVYRTHASGMTAKFNEAEKGKIKYFNEHLQIMEFYNKYFNYKYDDVIQSSLNAQKILLSIAHFKTLNLRKAIYEVKDLKVNDIKKIKRKWYVVGLKSLRVLGKN